jgi:L-amino acid N-acyltransferase YncA
MIKQARRDEIDTFYTLWEEFLKEHQEFSGHPVSPELLNAAGKSFQAYTNGSLDGFVLFWCDSEGEPQGVLMGGETSNSLSTPPEWGRTGLLHGLYLRKEVRGSAAGVELMQECCRLSHKLGFVSAMTVVKNGNASGEAMARCMKATKVETHYMVDLGRF